MSSTTNNYFLNVNTYFRDTDKYPNPCDFGINFSRFDATGTFVQGLPENVNSLFQQISIDPDYLDNDLQFVNATITQMSREDTSLLVSGIFDFTLNFQINYKNINLYYSTGYTYSTSPITGAYGSMYVPDMKLPFLVKFNFDKDAVIPYSIAWIFYIQPTLVPDIYKNNTTKTSFQLSTNNNIYYLFDFSLRYFDFIIYKNGISTIISSAGNPTIDPRLRYELMGNYGYVCLCLVYIDKDGDVGITNDHAYGYHIFNSNYDLYQSNLNGEFSLESDLSDNTFIGFNVNPFRGLPKVGETVSFLTGTLTYGMNSLDVYTGRREFFFENSTGTVAVGLTQYAYLLNILNFITGPYKSWFILDDPNSIYLKTYITIPEPGIASTTVANGVGFTGPNYEVFLWVSSLDSSQNLTNPTGSSIYLVDKNTFSTTRVARLSSTGAGSLAYSKIGTTIYLVNQNITNYLDVYTFNTSTYLLTYKVGIQIPSAYFFLRQLFIIDNNTDLFIYSFPQGPGADPRTYYSEDYFTAYVLKYDSIANTISIINTLPAIKDWTAHLISLSKRPDKLYLLYPAASQNKVYIYDITDPYNITIKNYIQAFSACATLTFTNIQNGITKYYVQLALIGGSNNKIFYDITDINNIVQLGPIISKDLSVVNVAGTTFGERNGYFWGQIFHNSTASLAAAPSKTPGPFFNQNIVSTQYKQNLARVTQSPTNAVRCIPFNLNNTPYTAFISQTQLTIYNISSTRALNIVSTIPLSLATTINDLQTINYNNTQYFVVSGLGYIFVFLLSSNLLSITPVGLFTAIPDSYSESHFFIFNNNLFFISLSYSSYIYRFTVFPSLSLTNSPYLLTPGRIPAGGLVYFSPTNQQLLYITVSNFTAISDPLLAFDVSSGITLTSSRAALPGLQPRSGSTIIDPRTGLVYGSGYASVGIGIYNINSNNCVTWLTPFNNTQAVNILGGRLNGMTKFFYIDRPYIITNQYGGPSSNGDYLTLFDMSNWELGIQLFDNNIGVTSTGASPASPVFLLDMQISQFEDKVTLICLNSNGFFYLYDLSNPSFAGKYQQLVKSTVTTPLPTSFGSSCVYKLTSEGDDVYNTWLRNVNTSTGLNGQRVNIANIKISSDNLSMYVCGGFTDQIQSYNYNSTSPSNQITSFGKKYNGYIAKIDTITGNWSWIIPIIGSGDDFVQKLQYISSTNRIAVCGYSESQNLIVLQKQTSGTLVTPTIPQSNILGSANITNSYLIYVSPDGIIGWTTNIYSEDATTIVNVSDIGYEGSQIVVTGISNSKTIKCNNSSGVAVQNLYTDNFTNTEYTLINYYFDLSGNYLKSQYVNLPDITTAFINDIKIYSSLNYITFCPTINYSLDTTTYYYNKDGSLSYTATGISNTISSYLVNYLYDSSFTDTNGKQYSYVKLINQPNYPFTGGFFENYNLYIGPATDQIYLNKNFSVRTNLEFSTGDYRFILNNKLDTSKIDRLLFPINNITGSQNYYSCNLSSSSLVNIFEYNISQMPTIDNTITSIGLVADLDESIQYYISIVKYNQFFSYPVENISINSNGDYVFQLQNVNDLRISTGGSFYGPYLYLTQFNQNVFYNLQFYPSSLNTPVYYSIQLNSLVLPNRPLRQNPKKYIRTLTDMPYIYVAIYSVDDEDLADQEIVNIVYDNNPNREKIEIFQLNTINAGDTSNFVTYTSSTVPKVKFNSSFTTLRIKIFDPYGKILLFDNTPYKSVDSIFTGDVVPPELMNISIQFTLIKKF